jgi:DNA-binding winged helix-turn-helix (wHTH) protein
MGLGGGYPDSLASPSMTQGSVRFAEFELDPGDRRLRRAGAPVELNARYFDTLALMVGEAGRLVSKDRFLDEVWRGVPVTDEALTQCIKTLRRQLGDDATRPRFIETVPKHGYRFIAAVDGGTSVARPEPVAEPAATTRWTAIWQLGVGGTLGGAAAGLVGGLAYGLATASLAPTGIGVLSVLLVLMVVTFAIGLVGAAGVSFGMALAGAGRFGEPWSIAGGALGGLLVGALVKLVGIDGFALLVGRGPGDVTGAGEGVVLGAAVGLGAWLAARAADASPRRAVAIGALVCAAAGAAIPLIGGRLLLGSLDQLARRFPDAPLRLDPLGRPFGEATIGPLTQSLLGALEAGLFGGCVIAALIVVQRRRAGQPRAASI